MERIYRTIKFSKNAPPETIDEDLTLAEAQAKCKEPNTSGEGWFIGYDYMKGCAPVTLH